MTLTAEGDPLMHRFLMALSATLLSATIATAQTGGNRHACPTTLDLTYTQIGKLDFGGPPDPKLDLTGWQPRYAPATARLLAAGVADADGSGQMQSIVPDNADSAKPGEPTLYTVWAKGQKQPTSPAYITCEYEGGLMLRKALPATTRSCSVRDVRRKASPSETTTREFLTTADVSCQ